MWNEYMHPARVDQILEKTPKPVDNCMTSPVVWEKAAGGWFGLVRGWERPEDHWRVITAMCRVKYFAETSVRT